MYVIFYSIISAKSKNMLAIRYKSIDNICYLYLSISPYNRSYVCMYILLYLYMGSATSRQPNKQYR